MAAPLYRLGVSSREILPVLSLLLLLLLSSSPLRSIAAAGNDDAHMEKKFSICKHITGHFRVQFLGLVIECPQADAPKLDQTSGTLHRGPGPAPHFDGRHPPPPVTPVSVRTASKKNHACDDGSKADACKNDEL